MDIIETTTAQDPTSTPVLGFAITPIDAWIVQMKGDSDDWFAVSRIIVGNQAEVLVWVETFLTDRAWSMEALCGSMPVIKARVTNADTVQGIASTTDGLAYVQVRAMLFNVEVL